MGELTRRSQAWLLRNIMLPLGDRVFGQQMMRRLRFLEQAQWWDPERLHRQRDQLLQQVCATAYHEVPFYRELMDTAKVRPEEIRSPADLQRLPVLTKDIMRTAYPDRIVRPTGQKTYEVRTSGSTGKNFCVRQDAYTAGWYRASFLLVLGWTGWRFGEPHMQTGMTFDRSLDRRLKDALMGCHYISAARLDDAELDRHLAVIEQRRIRHLWGYPGSLYCLSRRAREVGWNQPLKAVVSWGDNLYPHYRAGIEAAFQTRVFDTYGCAEGMHISAQCGQDEHYHVHTLDVAVEYLDEAGMPVAAGEPGYVVLTRLHAGPMPLLRYRLGDVGRAGPDGRCACGRGFDRMSQIQGRDTDVVLTPSGNRLIVHYFTGLLEHFVEIDEFQVVQEEVGAISLRVVPTAAFSADTARAIIKTLQRDEAKDLQIHLETVPEIGLTPGGKRRFIISRLAPQPGVEARE